MHEKKIGDTPDPNRPATSVTSLDPLFMQLDWWILTHVIRTNKTASTKIVPDIAPAIAIAAADNRGGGVVAGGSKVKQTTNT